MKNQISIGTKIESEHKETVAFIKSYFQEYKKLPSNKEIYKHIAENHVAEISDYYTRLIEMEKQVEADKKRSPLEIEILQFLIKNPNPDDPAIHALAEKKGIDAHKFEAMVYKIATERAEMSKDMQKARVTKYIKRIPDGKGGYKYFYKEDLKPRVGKQEEKPKSQTDTPEFKAWFGESKVVDKDGKPLVVYHGTYADFNEFDETKTRDIGVHFGTEKQANFFGNKINAVFLSAITNEDAMEDVFSDRNLKFSDILWALQDVGLLKREQRYILEDKWDTNSMRELRNKATYLDDRDDEDFFIKYQNVVRKFWKDVSTKIKENGFNGIKYNNSFEGEGESFVVFSPTQIKSATGNNGKFDPKESNMTKSKNLAKLVKKVITNKIIYRRAR